ncbi:hypothetical protein [Longitalea luteola]|uniref:hypothetical protein n=1 Tax=Longitalea luteola TaxID=2812563 RepID=UPI001A976453|nr:hypothetical protein [Longitalea luteola]
MKKTRLSLAALALVLAIAGTTTANATKSQEEAFPCSVVDPGGTFCLNQTDIECCEDDFTHEVVTEKVPIIDPL